MNNREIIAFSTREGKNKYTTDTETWGDLKTLISGDYNLHNLQAVENINKTSLVLEDAILPTGDFVLFLRPIRTKAGIEKLQNKSFKELRKVVKKYKKSHGDKFLEHINVAGNYTRLSTEELRKVLSSFNKKTSKDNKIIALLHKENEALDNEKNEITEKDFIFDIEVESETLSDKELYEIFKIEEFKNFGDETKEEILSSKLSKVIDILINSQEKNAINRINKAVGKLHRVINSIDDYTQLKKKLNSFKRDY